MLCVLRRPGPDRRHAARTSRSGSCSTSSAPTGPSCSSGPRLVVGTKADVADPTDRGTALRDVRGDRRGRAGASSAALRRARRRGPRRRARARGLRRDPPARGRGRHGRAGRRARVPRPRPRRPSGPSRCPTSPTAEALAYIDDRLKRLGVDQGAGPGRRPGRRRRVHRRASASSTSRTAEPMARGRRQDRHVVAHRRARGQIDAAPWWPSCASEVADAARGRATRSWSCRSGAVAAGVAALGLRAAADRHAHAAGAVGRRPEPADADVDNDVARPTTALVGAQVLLVPHDFVEPPPVPARPPDAGPPARAGLRAGRQRERRHRQRRDPLRRQRPHRRARRPPGRRRRARAADRHSTACTPPTPAATPTPTLIDEVRRRRPDARRRGRRRRARTGGAAAWRPSWRRPASPRGRACGR